MILAVALAILGCTSSEPRTNTRYVPTHTGIGMLHVVTIDKRIGTIMFSKYQSAFLFNQKGLEKYLGELCYPRNRKVIGNIHDNIELLKP